LIRIDTFYHFLNTYLNKNEPTQAISENENIKEKSLNEKLDILKISEKLGVSEKIALMVIDKFKMTILKDLNELKNFVDNEDLENISKKAHYLKSSCLNVNLNEISEILSELEKVDTLSINEIKLKFNLLKEQIENLF